MSCFIRCHRILRTPMISITQHTSCFVKIILTKNDRGCFAAQKPLFGAPKTTLLPCKRAAFVMQNNGFYNAL